MRRPRESEEHGHLAADDLRHVQEFRHGGGRQHMRLVNEECDARASAAVDQAQVWTASFVGRDSLLILDAGDGCAGIAVDRGAT